ncbi:MAG: UTP--glucose-1-phosphate uridylyltransferase [Candidatus Ancillula sp.]|nr:UTP--glucose-1-phosphate uridylyltransferase [Candidatus Ancillula sp.]
MLQIGAGESFIKVFERNYRLLESEASQFIDESEISGLRELQYAENLVDSAIDESEYMLVKLNGGLGTTMGLKKAKSLLEAKDGLTFLDVILRQVLSLRSGSDTFPLVFMNSFNTSADTLDFVNKNYPDFQRHPLEFLQHQQPKILKETLAAVEFPTDPKLEWCPPGHGDFYNSFYTSGLLHYFLEHGVKYAFVSNADNLGATFSHTIAKHFENTGATIMLELAEKTADDVKGGHIVFDKSGKMLLREVAQIRESDMEAALDARVHPYFNTNSIWLNLEQLHAQLADADGVLDLPLIVNTKTVDPKDKTTPECIQLESAIGAGVSALDKTAVVCVPRTRFLPVKRNSDLEVLRSDAFVLDEMFNMRKV